MPSRSPVCRLPSTRRSTGPASALPEASEGELPGPLSSRESVVRRPYRSSDPASPMGTVAVRAGEGSDSQSWAPRKFPPGASWRRGRPSARPGTESCTESVEAPALLGPVHRPDQALFAEGHLLPADPEGAARSGHRSAVRGTPGGGRSCPPGNPKGCWSSSPKKRTS